MDKKLRANETYKMCNMSGEIQFTFFRVSDGITVLYCSWMVEAIRNLLASIH